MKRRMFVATALATALTSRLDAQAGGETHRMTADPLRGKGRKSMSDANRDLVNLMIEEIQNRKNIGLMDEIFSAHFRNHTPPQGISNDRSGMRQLFSMIYVAFPDGMVVVEDQISSEGKVWTRKTFTGTHSGPLRGIAATGKKVTYEVFDILQIQGGKIIAHWSLADQLSLLRQIGAIKT